MNSYVALEIKKDVLRNISFLTCLFFVQFDLLEQIIAKNSERVWSL